MQLAESKERLWACSVIKCSDCRRDPSQGGRSVATCALNLVTDESRSIWRILKVWIFCCQRGYVLLCVVPFLAPQLRLMDFKVWNILPAQSPSRLQSDIQDSSTSVCPPQNNGSCCSHPRGWPAFFPPIMGMKFSWASKCRKIDKMYVLSRRVTRDRLGRGRVWRCQPSRRKVEKPQFPLSQ